MTRRDLFRQAVAGAAAGSVAAAREFPPDYDASKELARADWKPVFLDDHQNRTLAAFSEVLIPQTDTPGAQAALVNRFIDQVLAAETRETQRTFLDSLAFLDGESFDHYRAPFADLTPEQQIDVVTFMAFPQTLQTWDEPAAEDPGHAHFSHLKDWIARAYYNSEAGMRALGYTGIPHGEFEGCQ
jgi:glucoside 3-dehydrogenase (cytochrome c) hitch-hiker subunit